MELPTAIPATQKVELGGLWSKASPKQKHEILPQKIN
jgi:hypothetical protein